MFWRTLSIILCLSLTAPVGHSADETSPPVQASSEVKVDHQAEAAPVAAKTVDSDTAKPLTADEEASLSARAEQPGPEVAGGALSNLHLTYAVIALAAIVLVLILK